jgi:hypothetical protein
MLTPARKKSNTDGLRREIHTGDDFISLNMTRNRLKNISGGVELHIQLTSILEKYRIM